jgi:hypothetical protein
MKKILNLVFAVAMMFSIVFIGEAISSNAPFSVNAQEVTVKRKRRPGIARSTYRGGKWVVKKSWNGTKYVSKKVWQGTEMDRQENLQNG